MYSQKNCLRSRLPLASLHVPLLPSAQNDNQLQLNQIQVIGSHNSYHAGIAPNEMKIWQAKYPDSFKGLDYQHQPLTQQLDSGVRQIELDVFADSQGGKYAHPNGPHIVEAAKMPPDPAFDPNHIMDKPGFKVMHMQDIDYRSTCEPFTACLKEVRHWSHAHPKHIPVFILVETKQEKPRPGIQMTVPEPFTESTFDALDAEIRSVFPAKELITPDDVRGHYETLNEAVLAGNWPTLAHARGKVDLSRWISAPLAPSISPVIRLFVAVCSSPTLSPASPMQLSLSATTVPPPTSPRSSTRATWFARAQTPTQKKHAPTTPRDATHMMATGAQILSTDYPVNEPARWPGNFVVTLPDKADARANPVECPCRTAGQAAALVFLCRCARRSARRQGCSLPGLLEKPMKCPRVLAPLLCLAGLVSVPVAACPDRRLCHPAQWPRYSSGRQLDPAGSLSFRAGSAARRRADRRSLHRLSLRTQRDRQSLRGQSSGEENARGIEKGSRG